ncbi:MAG TPA: M20/M25/M40 family metallo-hydrolase [Nitrososphaeraceae archaeon]|nr:M20/M25/M40 family metallo-hydrolase [Nitrososphaeraceae archaeon]
MDIAKMNNDDAITDLQDLIRQPSVSAKNQGLVACANLVVRIMKKAGIDTKLLYIDDRLKTEKEDISPPPLVYGEVRSKSNPNGKTILFYNHYDVQPVEPLELWEEDPYSGKVQGNYIFGRGSADDKGELITRIKAVEYYLNYTGDLPCNVKFIVEGEEEIGSIHLKKYFSLYKEKFECDGVIWESGFVDSSGRPIISLGQKGILSVEFTSRGPSRDAHSSLAVLIENPAWNLVRVLNSLRDNKGKILIKDWYNEARDFTNEELSLIDQEPFDEEELKKEYGITNFLNNAKGIEAKKAFAGMPTCNISGLVSGYVGKGSKTMLPAVATAKVDFRLVPDMIPEVQFERLRKHLDEHRLGDNEDDEIELRFLDGEPAARTPVNNSFVNTVKEAAVEVYGDVIVNVSSAGTGPMYYFAKLLGVPSVCIGGTDLSNRSHSPNEYMRIDSLDKTIKCITIILEKFACTNTNVFKNKSVL